MDSQQDSPTKIRILLVDDHAILRGGLRKLLETEPDLAVVAEAATGVQALDIIRSVQPDVTLLDVNLPDLNGLEVAARLKAERQTTAVVLLTAYDDPEQEVHAMRAGAVAYCAKAIEPARLFEVIRQAAQGQYVIDGKIYTRNGVDNWLAMHSPGRLTDEAERIASLSPREMEILRCVTRGLSNKVIAHELGISHQTVRNHMTSILNKLNVRGRTEAAVYALKRGWVRQEDFHPPDDDAEER